MTGSRREHRTDGTGDDDGRPLSRREQERREKAARRHQLGRPEVTEVEVGDRTYKVAHVEPLDLDGTRTILVGSLLWLVAAIALLPFLSTLEDNGRMWWLWTCLAGFGLGTIGIEYCRRRRRALAHDPERSPTDTSPYGPVGL